MEELPLELRQERMTCRIAVTVRFENMIGMRDRIVYESLKHGTTSRCEMNISFAYF
jgi:hypothetical protein